MQETMIENPYLQMPLSRCIADAEAGVSLARSALRQRDPRWADQLSIGIEREEAAAKGRVERAKA